MSKLTTFLDNRDKDELQEQINEKANKTDISSPYNFKGNTTVGELPLEGNEVNDTYYCTDAKGKYTWNGTGWYQSSMNEYDYEEIATPTVHDFTDAVTTTARMSAHAWLIGTIERPKGYTATRINSLSVKVEGNATVRFSLYSRAFAADGETPILKCVKVFGDSKPDPETGIAKLEIEGGYYTEQEGLFPMFCAKDAVISCAELGSVEVHECPHFDDVDLYDNKEGDEIICSLEEWSSPILPAYGIEYDNIVASSIFAFAKNISARVVDMEEKVDGTQEKLVSGENIKTINGKSILGDGNLTVYGDGVDIDSTLTVDGAAADAKATGDRLDALEKGDTTTSTGIHVGPNAPTGDEKVWVDTDDEAENAGSGLPTVTASDNGKVLQVVDGAWAAAELSRYLGEHEEVE